MTNTTTQYIPQPDGSTLAVSLYLDTQFLVGPSGAVPQVCCICRKSPCNESRHAPSPIAHPWVVIRYWLGTGDHRVEGFGFSKAHATACAATGRVDALALNS